MKQKEVLAEIQAKINDLKKELEDKRKVLEPFKAENDRLEKMGQEINIIFEQQKNIKDALARIIVNEEDLTTLTIFKTMPELRQEARDLLDLDHDAFDDFGILEDIIGDIFFDWYQTNLKFLLSTSDKILESYDKYREQLRNKVPEMFKLSDEIAALGHLVRDEEERYKKLSDRNNFLSFAAKMAAEIRKQALTAKSAKMRAALEKLFDKKVRPKLDEMVRTRVYGQ